MGFHRNSVEFDTMNAIGTIRNVMPKKWQSAYGKKRRCVCVPFPATVVMMGVRVMPYLSGINGRVR